MALLIATVVNVISIKAAVIFGHFEECVLCCRVSGVPLFCHSPLLHSSLCHRHGGGPMCEQFQKQGGGGGGGIRPINVVGFVKFWLCFLKSGDWLSNTKRHFCFASCSYSLKWKQFVMTLTCVFFLFVQIWIESFSLHLRMGKFSSWLGIKSITLLFNSSFSSWTASAMTSGHWLRKSNMIWSILYAIMLEEYCTIELWKLCRVYPKT